MNFRALRPSIDSNDTTMINAKKARTSVVASSKDIGKIVHVTSGVQPQSYEATRILFMRKENNNNIIYSTILLPELPSSDILERNPERNQCNERCLLLSIHPSIHPSIDTVQIIICDIL